MDTHTTWMVYYKIPNPFYRLLELEGENQLIAKTMNALEDFSSYADAMAFYDKISPLYAHLGEIQIEVVITQRKRIK